MPKPEDAGAAAWPPGWIVPDWPAPPGVRALFTTREGGVSAPPHDSFNLGDHVRDDPAAVQANRQRLQQAIGVRPVFLQQVHGTEVLELEGDTPDGAVADACLSTHPGVACTVMVADCLPVLFAHRSAGVVAAAHAGWRGLAGAGADAQAPGAGVLESTWEALLSAVQRHSPGLCAAEVAADTIAWLGPCIGPDAFEVGPDVRAAFVQADAGAGEGFRAQAGGKWLANLPWLARQRLAALGLRHVHGNDGSAPWCTVSNARDFFSHRRDAGPLGSTGRMAASVWLA